MSVVYLSCTCGGGLGSNRVCVKFCKLTILIMADYELVQVAARTVSVYSCLNISNS